MHIRHEKVLKIFRMHRNGVEFLVSQSYTSSSTDASPNSCLQDRVSHQPPGSKKNSAMSHRPQNREANHPHVAGRIGLWAIC